MHIEAQVDDIINELLENHELRDFLEQADIDVLQDEGIELNVHDEIEMDIEPFDYNLEVEPFDF